MIPFWYQKSRNVGTFCIAEHFKDQMIQNGLFSAFFANKFVLQTQLDLHSALVVFQVLDAIQFEHNIQNLGLHRGAFCQFPFRWIYYCHSSKSTGKKAGKLHLCALFKYILTTYPRKCSIYRYFKFRGHTLITLAGRVT